MRRSAEAVRLVRFLCDICLLHIFRSFRYLFHAVHAASAMIQKIKELLPLEWCIIQPHPLNKKREYDLYSADNSEYQHFLSMAYQDFEGTSSTKVLGRNNDTYSTYWELLPDNKICRLSSDENYSFCKEFVQNNFALILSEIIKSDNSITI